MELPCYSGLAYWYKLVERFQVGLEGSEGRPKKSDWPVFSALLLVGFLKIGLVLDHTFPNL